MSLTISGTQLSYSGVPVTDVGSSRNLQVDSASGVIALTGSSVLAGCGCTFVGQMIASASDLRSTYDTAFGYEALQRCSGTDSCTAIGAYAGQTYNNASSCVFVGYGSGTTGVGQQNVVVGRLAAASLTGSNCVLIGDRAGQNVVGDGHVVVGAQAGRSLQGSSATLIGSNISTLSSVIRNGVYCGSGLSLQPTDSDKLVVYPGWRLIDASRDITQWLSNTFVVSKSSFADGNIHATCFTSPTVGSLHSQGSAAAAMTWSQVDVAFGGNVASTGFSSSFQWWYPPRRTQCADVLEYVWCHLAIHAVPAVRWEVVQWCC